ncbi:MAG: PAS domain-containing protein [Acidobacteriales bacterium]|nr:PAS domain-containing protein [Terriglobales bacterium]
MHRRVVIGAAITGLFAHAAVLYAYGDQPPGPLISNLLQFTLGIGGTLCAWSAARNSGWFARKVWRLVTVALAIYTAGQGIVIYYDNVVGAPLFSPWISDQFLFFWVVPLLMATLIDPFSGQRKVDWALVMDFCQVILFALALHVSVFAVAANWQSHGQELAFLEWQMRMVRDGVVMAALLARVVLAVSQNSGRLFTRIAAFFLAYAIADGIYLYAEAAWHNRVGSWLDLLWTVPRIVLIISAITWKDEWRHVEVETPKRTRRQVLPLHLAPVVGPLMILWVTSRMSASAPTMAALLVGSSFVLASIRFLITQERQDRVTNELRRNRDLLEAIIEGTTEVVYLRDLEGRYVLVNGTACKVLTRTREEIIGRRDEDFFPAANVHAIRESDAEVVRTGKACVTEDSLVIGGQTKTYFSTKGPHRDSTGKVIGVLGIAVDVTERRKMEEQLRKAQRMESIGTLAGGVAHDFNNLLTVIKGYSQLLLETATDGNTKEGMQEIDAAADRAAALTRQLLAFSRQQVLQPRIVDLNTVIRGMEKMLKRLIGEDVECRLRFADGLHPVLADPTQIEQVVMNLAVNARDAMPRGGVLRIQTANTEIGQSAGNGDSEIAPGSFVLLRVEDTGMGMDAATQAKVFEPFFTTKPQGKGTGLGLSTVYGIVKQSGGTIEFQSKVGEGTVFQIHLPVAKEGAESEPVRSGLTVIRQGHETVLVVEDDIALRGYVASVLEKSGYRVLVAESPEHAETLAQEFSSDIHLLLTDVVMPRTSGLELARRICLIRRETRVLWMSGHSDETIVRHGMVEQGVHLLPKPFTPAILAAKVRETLESQGTGPGVV